MTQPRIKCPKCRATMKIRIAKTGAYVGNQFYGCSKYPKCKGIRNIQKQLLKLEDLPQNINAVNLDSKIIDTHSNKNNVTPDIKIKKYTIIVSILIFSFTFIILKIIFPPTRCSDGTYSQAIGHRGACSHHGGVVDYTWFALILAGIITIIIFALLNPKNNGENQNSNSK